MVMGWEPRNEEWKGLKSAGDQKGKRLDEGFWIWEKL